MGIYGNSPFEPPPTNVLGVPIVGTRDRAKELKDMTDLEVNGEKEELEEQIDDLNLPDLSTLAGRICNEFDRYRSARQPQERQIWLRAFLNNKGVYSGDMDFNGGTSQAFVQATRPKVQTAIAMAMGILMPPGDQAWTLEAPPEPYLPEEAYQMLQQGMAPGDIKSKLRDLSDQRAEKLSLKIESGLDQDQWPTKYLQFVTDWCLLGTGIIEGPLAVKTLSLQDVELETAKDKPLGVWDRIKSFMGRVQQEVPTAEKIHAALIDAGVLDAVRPELTVWSPFDVYVDPGARRVEDCNSIIIRMTLSRQDVRDLRKLEGFDQSQIDAALEQYPEGNWTPESWESVIAVGNTQFQQNQPNGRFVILKRWGVLSGKDLRDCNIEVPEDRLEEQCMAQVWVIGDKVIRLSVSDELHAKRIPIYMAPYSTSPHSIWGVGLAEMMFDSQDAINACERAKMDNMALICRPQAMVDLDQIQNPNDNIVVKPGKIWAYRKSELNPNSSNKPIDFWIPANALPEISGVQNESMKLAEEQTAFPSFLQGQNSEGTHNRTAQGATLQFDRAVTPFKTPIFNVEQHLIVPMIACQARFYQLFSNDPDIKGDFKVVAKGVQGLMAREMIAQRLQMAMQAVGGSPQLAEEVSSVINMGKVFQLFLRGTGLEDANIFYTDQEQQQRRQQEQQQQQQEAQQKMAIASAPKQRAETPPKDAILDLAKMAPDNSQTQLALLQEAVQAWNFMDPTVAQAFQHDMADFHLQAVSRAHEAGAGMADRESPIEAAQAMAQQQNQPQGGEA